MKKTLILLAGLGVACTAAVESPLTVESETRKIASQVFEAFNAHDWELMESLYADSVVLQDPSYPDGKVGKSGMSDFYRSVPDIHDEVKSIYCEGNKAVIEFVSTGTMEGKAFEMAICTVLTVENGKIVRDHTYYDAN